MLLETVVSKLSNAVGAFVGEGWKTPAFWRRGKIGIFLELPFRKAVRAKTTDTAITRHVLCSKTDLNSEAT